MNKFNFFVFLLCFSILAFGWSFNEYYNINSYDKFLKNFSYFEIQYNTKWYEQATAINEKNLSYKDPLFIIMTISFSVAIASGIVIFILKRRAVSSENLQLNLNTEKPKDINGFVGGERPK